MSLFFKSYFTVLCIMFVHAYIMCPENTMQKYLFERVISTTENAIHNPGQRHAFFFDDIVMDDRLIDQIGKKICDIQEEHFRNDNRSFAIRNYIDKDYQIIIIVSEKLSR